MAHPFEFTHEIEVDASPEEVWEAIATGPGRPSASWYRFHASSRSGTTGPKTFTGVAVRPRK